MARCRGSTCGFGNGDVYGSNVNYKMGLPNQGWHFICSYLDNVSPEKAKISSISCGELIYWWAEVSSALSEDELDTLASDIKALNRRQANSLIRSKCFPRVFEKVMSASKAA